ERDTSHHTWFSHALRVSAFVSVHTYPVIHTLTPLPGAGAGRNLPWTHEAKSQDFPVAVSPRARGASHRGGHHDAGATTASGSGGSTRRGRAGRSAGGAGDPYRAGGNRGPEDLPARGIG